MKAKSWKQINLSCQGDLTVPIVAGQRLCQAILLWILLPCSAWLLSPIPHVRSQEPFSKLVAFGASTQQCCGTPWVSYIASALNIPLDNRAWGGADIGGVLTQTRDYAQEGQVDELKLHAFLDGIVSQLVGGNVGRDPAEVASEWATVITENIAAAGGRQFLIPTLFPLGDFPIVKGGDEEKRFFNERTEDFNAALSLELEGLQSSLGVTVIRPDFYGFLREIDQDPDRFGIKLHADDTHFTDNGHRLLADVALLELFPPPPNPPVTEVPGSYRQDFDKLGSDGHNIGVNLPIGWGVLGERRWMVNSSISHAFEPGTRPRLKGDGEALNAGMDGESDRSLSTGLARRGIGNELQFNTEIVGETANQMRLQFDIEAWQAGRTDAGKVGEAAFHVFAEVDSGTGFETVLDLGAATTGPTLVVPEDRLINGNQDAFRTHYNSGWLNDVFIPEHATLRLRWITDATAATTEWTFGLDNVQLELGILGDVNRDGLLDVVDVDTVSQEVWNPSGDLLFDLTSDGDVTGEDMDTLLELTHRLNGDADFDGAVQFSDFLVLSNNFGQAGKKWSEGDFDSNGSVQFADFLILSGNFGETTSAAAVPEPNSLILATIGLAGTLLRRRKDARLQIRSDCTLAKNLSACVIKRAPCAIGTLSKSQRIRINSHRIRRLSHAN